MRKPAMSILFIRRLVFVVVAGRATTAGASNDTEAKSVSSVNGGQRYGDGGNGVDGTPPPTASSNVGLCEDSIETLLSPVSGTYRNVLHRGLVVAWGIKIRSTDVLEVAARGPGGSCFLSQKLYFRPPKGIISSMTTLRAGTPHLGRTIDIDHPPEKYRPNAMHPLL